MNSKNRRGNLKVVPLKETDWKVKVLEGQEEPEVRGWYSVEYNKFEPNKEVVFSTIIEKNEVFVWLLLPFEKEAPDFDIKIISENESVVELKITDEQKGSWYLTVPFSNSSRTKFEFDRKP